MLTSRPRNVPVRASPPGDAYVACALLPPSRTDAAVIDACRRALAAAGAMLRAAESPGPAGGGRVLCRIGIGLGPVVAGVLGRLQPRFRVLGPGALAAEALEQSGTPAAVHLCPAVACALNAPLPDGAGPARPPVTLSAGRAGSEGACCGRLASGADSDPVAAAAAGQVEARRAAAEELSLWDVDEGSSTGGAYGRVLLRPRVAGAARSTGADSSVA
jgi:hypothetical protein